MTAVPSSPAPRPISSVLLPFRLARRELRGGLRGFLVFIACIALGVMAIAGVGSFARGLIDGLAREGQTILGGDLSFGLIQREASADERAFLARQGDISVAATMRAMARAADGRSTLVELKAVDGAYPLFGAVATAPADPLATLIAKRGEAFGAAVDETLLARLDLKVGDRVGVGDAVLEITATLMSEPDKLGGVIGFGPRVMIGDEALRATGLLQPGSLVRWLYRLRLPAARSADADVKAAVVAAGRELPDAGWDIRTRSRASPQLERNVERFTQYLTLVGLTALLIGGVGVANSVKYYLDRKSEVIATLKSLGASGGRVFSIYFVEILLLASLGVGIGLVLGGALPFLLAGVLKPLVPLPFAPSIEWRELALAAVYGLLTAAAFAIWPLGRAHDVPVSALFRDTIEPERRWPRKRYIAATVIAVAALAGLAVFAAFDRRIAIIFIGAAGAVFLSLRLLAAAVMALARRAPRARMTALRLAIANIHRPGALTPTVVLSLGLGLALLVGILEIDANLRRQLVAALPEKAPSFFFLDIPSAEAEQFDSFVHAAAPRATFERVPISL